MLNLYLDTQIIVEKRNNMINYIKANINILAKKMYELNYMNNQFGGFSYEGV